MLNNAQQCYKISNCVQKFDFQENNKIVSWNFRAKNEWFFVIFYCIDFDLNFRAKIVKIQQFWLTLYVLPQIHEFWGENPNSNSGFWFFLISHLIWYFDILAFFTNFCPTESDLSGNTVLPQALCFQKSPIFGIFCPLKM